MLDGQYIAEDYSRKVSLGVEDNLNYLGMGRASVFFKIGGPK